MAMMLVIINRVVAVRISRPILKLNDSVKEYEAGEKPEIYIGGSSEIRHLGLSIQSSYEQIDTLMKEIVLEQNERRKSEFDARRARLIRIFSIMRWSRSHGWWRESEMTRQYL